MTITVGDVVELGNARIFAVVDPEKMKGHRPFLV
jgi:hypothetical protein